MAGVPALAIKFAPALYLQRQGFLLQTLRTVKPTSVLDVGCGEGSLIECLVRIDKDLPVELIGGIDLSIPTLENATRTITSSAEVQQSDGRWNSLRIVLLHGIPRVIR
jgi:2-polyprenyl-3-methyl-5-hydroxy-6-metoxy-1,4-benzoquinol methylase